MNHSFYTERVSESGHKKLYKNGYDINWSSIQTHLIQLAGRYCERFASDIIITINHIQRLIDNGEITDSEINFGFRDSGVDSSFDFYDARKKSPNMYGANPYRKEAWITVSTDGDCLELALEY